MKTNTQAIHAGRRTLSMPVRYLINSVLIALLIIASFLVSRLELVSSYYIGVLVLVGINIIMAVSLNVATGYLGQLPLGHAGFMAVGGYTGGIFLKAVNISDTSGVVYVLLLIVALVLSGIMAGIFGIIIGVPALRLRGDYLAIITLGFGEIIRVILNNIDSVLGFSLTYGASGLKRIPAVATLPVVTVCVVLVCLLIHMVLKSRHGRAVLAIRENEIAAEACGIPTTYYKTMAFVLSAFCAGIAGCLYAGYLRTLVPNTFDFMKSIEFLIMVVLGGMGSMLGSILSASVLTILPEALRQFADFRMVAYSIVLIVVMIFRAKGLLGTYDFSLSRLLEKAMNMGRGKEKEGKTK